MSSNPEQSQPMREELDPKQGKRARRRKGMAPGISMLAQGEPLLWLTGGALALAILMIIGMLGFIVWQGALCFWPRPVERVLTSEGRLYMGEVAREELYQPTQADLERLLKQFKDEDVQTVLSEFARDENELYLRSFAGSYADALLAMLTVDELTSLMRELPDTDQNFVLPFSEAETKDESAVRKLAETIVDGSNDLREAKKSMEAAEAEIKKIEDSYINRYESADEQITANVTMIADLKDKLKEAEDEQTKADLQKRLDGVEGELKKAQEARRKLDEQKDKELAPWRKQQSDARQKRADLQPVLKRRAALATEIGKAKKGPAALARRFLEREDLDLSEFVQQQLAPLDKIVEFSALYAVLADRNRLMQLFFDVAYEAEHVDLPNQVTAVNGMILRRLIWTGNKRQFDSSFEWVPRFKITDQSMPDWAVVVERLEYGRFNGELTGFQMISAENSTAEVLEGGESFTGQQVDVSDFDYAEVRVETNVSSADGGVQFQVSEDGDRWRAAKFSPPGTGDDAAAVTSHKIETFGLTTVTYTVPFGEQDNYFRVKFTNGEKPQESGKASVVTKLVVENPEAAWRQYEKYIGPVEANREKMFHIKEDEIGPVAERESEARLVWRQAQIDYGLNAAETEQAEQRYKEIRKEAEQETRRLNDKIQEYIDENSRYRLTFRIFNHKRSLIPREQQLTAAKSKSPLNIEAVGQPASLSLQDIVRAYPANQMSTGDKFSTYFARWWEFLSANPREANTEGGVFPAIFGTVTMTLLMCIAVVPFGVLAALYLREYAQEGAIVSMVRIAINNLAGVPSIVFGVFGLGFFCYIVGGWIDGGSYNAFRWEMPRDDWLVWLGGMLAALAVGIACTFIRTAQKDKYSATTHAMSIVSLMSFLIAALLAVVVITFLPWFDGFFRARLQDGNPTFGSRGLIWASLTLALLTLPVVIVATEEALSAVPNSMREGSYACGASKWQTIQRVVLPRALPGIMTGMILAMARGAGEVAPLMLVGVVKLTHELPVDATFPFIHLDRSLMHLGFHIYDLGFQSPDSEAAKPMVFVTTLLLITIIAVLNISAIWLRNRLRRKFTGGQF